MKRSIYISIGLLILSSIVSLPLVAVVPTYGAPTPASHSIQVGTIEALSKLMPGKVTWTSSDSDVLLVTPDGYACGLIAGQATLTGRVGSEEKSFVVSVTSQQQPSIALPLVQGEMTYAEVEQYETETAHRILVSTEEMPGLSGYNLLGFAQVGDNQITVKYLVNAAKTEVIPYVTMTFAAEDVYSSANMPNYIREHYLRAGGVDFLEETFQGYARGNVGVEISRLAVSEDMDPVVTLTFFPIESKVTNPYDALLITSNLSDEISLKIKSRNTGGVALVNWGEGWTGYPAEQLVEVKGHTAKGEIKILCPDAVQLQANMIDLTSVDLTGLPSLQSLSLVGNRLETIDLSHHKQLLTLDCSGNALAEISLKAQSELLELNLAVNNLTQIDLSQQKKLCSLSLLGNRIETLDLSAQTKLEDLSVGMNRLSQLDLKHQPELYFVVLMKNQIKAAQMDELIESLPSRPNKDGMIKVLFSRDEETPEGNEIKSESIMIAQQKGWRVMDGSKIMAPEDGIQAIESLTAGVQIHREDDLLTIQTDEELLVYSLQGALIARLNPGYHYLTTQTPVLLQSRHSQRIYKGY